MRRVASYCFLFSLLVSGTACRDSLSTSPTDAVPSPATMSGSAASPTPDLEGFTCESLEEVRVRFNDPGFIRGNEVALYAAFLGAPPGDKFLRIYWDHVNKPTKFEIVDTQAGEVRRDNDELFDIEETVEHTYEELSGPTERTVRVELIHEDGNTRLCARNRKITVRPASEVEVIYSFNGSRGGPFDVRTGPERTFGNGSGVASWTEDGVVVNLAGGFPPLVVCPSGLGLSSASHATSIASTVRKTDGNGIAYFTGGNSTLGGKNISNCRVYVN